MRFWGALCEQGCAEVASAALQICGSEPAASLTKNRHLESGPIQQFSGGLSQSTNTQRSLCKLACDHLLPQGANLGKWDRMTKMMAVGTFKCKSHQVTSKVSLARLLHSTPF